MKGIGNSDDDVIAEILAARPNEYIEALKVILTDLFLTDLFSSRKSILIDFRAKSQIVTGLRAENQFWSIFDTKNFFCIFCDILILINFWAKNIDF